MTRIVAFLLMGASESAFAHTTGVTAARGGVSDLPVLLPLACTAALYVLGTLRLWRGAGFRRGVKLWQFMSFWLGWLFLTTALASPLHTLGQRLFTAHMIEHEILMAIAAPLLVAARPGAAIVWALPMTAREALAKLLRSRGVAGAWSYLAAPLMVTVLHGTAIWVWHVPSLYNAALASEGVHWLQHFSFFATALLFWWPLLRGIDRERVPGTAVLCLFLTSLHTGLLGVLLTLARHPWYPTQSSAAGDWGLTALEDQQLGGLVMWVPAGAIYAVAALALAALWIRTSAAKEGVHAI
jgi:putative membrane protein